MKNFLYIFVSAFFLASCKPTSNIITSKEIAEKKGIYSKPIASNTSTKKPEIKRNKEVDLKSTKKQNSINTSNDNDIHLDDAESSYLIAQLINTASDNLGVNYRSGGTTKEGFDCSGLIYSTFIKFNIELPRSSYEMAGKGIQVTLENVKKGDLIFFINRGQRRINHVGMVTEIKGDDIKFIHSSTQSGVIISSINEPYYKKTFAQINRILE